MRITFQSFLWLIVFWALRPVHGGEIGARELPPHAKVVIAEDLESIAAFTPKPDRIERMVERGLLQVTGQDSLRGAWLSLVSTQDVVGLRVFSEPGATSGTRPTVAAALIKSLLKAGIAPKNIVIWDRQLSHLRLAGFGELAEQFGVELAGSFDEGYDSQVFYETALLGKLVWGDLEFGSKADGVGRKSFVSKLITRRLTKIVNVTPLLNHNLAGVSGNLYGLAFASVDNSIRFLGGGPRLATAIPEIYALPELGDRVALNIVDALICQYHGEEKMLLHYSTMLGQLRFSTDPVALDVLSIQELDRQRQAVKGVATQHNWAIYTNASLLDIGISDPKSIVVFHVKD